MHEGYALFIEEQRANTSFCPEFIVSLIWFMVTVIRALYNQDLELVLNAVNWSSTLWASYIFVSSRFWGKPGLLIRVGKVFILGYYFHDGYMELGRGASALVLMVLISDMLSPIILRLLIRYSIRIDWKEVRGLFGNRNHSHGLV